MEKMKTQRVVRNAYGRIAQGQEGCGCGPDTKELARSVGYSEEELGAVPDGANMGLSCGNPTAFAGLQEGDVVLDLGAGAGLDCFLAATRVGPSGKVIGVDMTPEMIEKARESARTSGVENVEFRLGEIENLPVADSSVDVVISNCVINLSVDKSMVFQEIHRVLKPGGRVAISDIALLKELPKKIQESVDAYVGCVGGAILVDEYKEIVETSGLQNAAVSVQSSSACVGSDTRDPIGKALLEGLGEGESLQGYVVSVFVEGRK